MDWFLYDKDLGHKRLTIFAECSVIDGTKYSGIAQVKSRPHPFKFFKGRLPQIVLGPFLNTLANMFDIILTQPAITCSKLTIETLEQGVKYVQS